MKQFLALLLCLCGTFPILVAQTSQKPIGDRAAMQQYLSEHYADQAAFAEMYREVEERPNGSWAVQEQPGSLRLWLNKAEVLTLHYDKGAAEVEAAGNTDLTGVPVFSAQAVPFEHPDLDNSFLHYEVYRLDARAIRQLAVQRTTRGLQFGLQFGTTHEWLIRLQPSDLLAPDLTGHALTQRGTELVELPTNTLYQGHNTRFSITDDYVLGVLQHKGIEYFIEPLPRLAGVADTDLYVVYKSADVLSDPAVTCGKYEADHYAPDPTAPMQKVDPGPGCWAVTDLALAADFDMFSRYGSFGATAQHMFDITNMTELLYEDVQIDYRIVDVFIATSDADDPWTDSDDAFTIIDSFSDWAEINFATHDVGQLWITRDIQGCGSGPGNFGLIGCADAIGDICGPERYNICEDFSNNMNCLRALSAHEIGHLWDGVHSQAVDNVTIMFENIVCGATDFSAGNITRIENHRDSRGCLDELCCRLVVDCSNITDQDLDCRSDLPGLEYNLLIIDESCGDIGLSALTSVPGNPGCPGDPVVVERTYFVTDDEGNLFQCYQEFTIESTQGPDITCPLAGNNIRSLNEDCEYIVEDFAALATASAECSNFTTSVAQIPPTGTVISGETNTNVTLTVTDGCGRIDVCVFGIQTVDDTDPVITQCDGGTLVFDGEDNFPVTDAVTIMAEDACGIATIEYDPAFIYCDQLGETVPVQVTVTDIYGNTDMCVADVFVDGLPCGWMASYIGCSGDISYDVMAETFTVASDDCYYAMPFNQDQLAFAKYELCGDGEIVARVDNVVTQGWAGITMRENLTAGSKKVQLMHNAGFYARREVRNVTNGTAYPQQFPAFGKNWLRLVRNGNQFSGYISTNGSNWQFAMAANIVMPDCIQIGLVTTNFNSQTPATAIFGEVFVDPPYMGGSPLVADPGFPEMMAPPSTDDYRVHLFPNPTDGNLALDLANFGAQNLTLSLLNGYGQVQWERTLHAVDNQRETLSLDHLPEGVYWLRVQPTEGAAVVRRVVITK